MKDPILKACHAVALATALWWPLGTQAATEPAKAEPSADIGGQQINTTSGEVLQSVQMDGALLTDALSSLARQAGINFQFDPRLSAGGVGADGQTNQIPNVSFRFENVTAAQAFVAILDNYGLQFTADPRTKIGRVSIKDAKEPLVTRTFQLKYSSPTNMIALLQPSLQDTRGRILPDGRTSKLVVLATERELLNIATLIDKLDTATRQILIEARFLETSYSPDSIKGLDWSGTFAAQSLKFGNAIGGGAPGSAATPAGSGPDVLLSKAPQAYLSTMGSPAPGLLNADGLSAVLSFLNTDQQSESIAAPRAVTMENVSADLSVVRNVPIFEQEQGASSSGGTAPISTKPNYEKKVADRIVNEVGIKLVVTPSIAAETNVLLNLKPEISDFDGEASSTFNGEQNTSPIFKRSRLDTVAMVPSSYTLVLGGLMSDSNTKTLTKVPILGDIPGLGRAFRSDKKSRTKRNLLIFVTPTILGIGDFQNNGHPTDFLQSSPNLSMKNTFEDPYDSAEATDWTKPVN
jgi:type II secretory pathway component GspD/PulD (secretin)